MEIIHKPTDCTNCTLRSTLFESLEKKELACVHMHKKEILVEQGEEIVQRGTAITHFFYLQSGLLKLSSESDSNREQIISIARPRDFIGLLTIFSNTYHMYSISAIQPSRLCMIEVECIHKLVDNNGLFAKELLKNMSKAVDHILKDSYNLRSLQMHGRIAYIINLFSKEIFEQPAFDLPLSRKEIGQMIGVSTENVIRILSEFRKDGLLTIEGKHIEIMHPENLENIALRG